MQKDTHITIEVQTNDETRLGEAEKMKSLGLIEARRGDNLVLSFLDSHTELRRSMAKTGNGYRVNFSTIDRRLGAGNLSTKQPLPKAMGPSNHTVVDATAGFCGDAMLLALMGFQVTAIERSPIVCVLLRDGIRRAKEDADLWRAVDNRLEIIEGDSVELLHKYCGADVVYVDPMFPHKKKTSPLPPGHIQLLGKIVGNDEDADSLFEAASLSRPKRVVVKRPRYAPHMRENPVAVHEGKQVRYEVYVGKQSTGSVHGP